MPRISITVEISDIMNAVAAVRYLQLNEGNMGDDVANLFWSSIADRLTLSVENAMLYNKDIEKNLQETSAVVVKSRPSAVVAGTGPKLAPKKKKST
jgi:hypothetical protein